jgi:UDP-N-acetylmuramoyl-tripeptide--D-alanyl-D-alanine ligase
VLTIHRPTIIAIAGSTNKAFTKNEIKSQLTELGLEVRSNPKNFNTEIGMPLAILNLESGYNEYKKWLPAIWRAPLTVFDADFPKYLVLELGVSEPGDIKYLLSIIKPSIIVITDITQRYIESFAGMDELVGEYEYLVKRSKRAELIVLNCDNARIKKMAELRRQGYGNIVFFGYGKRANWQVVKSEKDDLGQKIKISHNNIINGHFIKRYGNHHVYSLLAGLIIHDYVKKKEKTKHLQGN